MSAGGSSLAGFSVDGFCQLRTARNNTTAPARKATGGSA